MIVQRYVFREVLQSFTAVLGILMLIYVSTRFVRILTEAAAGYISSELIFELLLLKLLSSVVLLLPLALFLGILLGLGRLYVDSEIVAMFASGIGLRRIGAGLLALIGLVTIVDAVLSFQVSPTVAALQESLRSKARHESEITWIAPGRFKSFGGGDQVIYVESVSADRSAMEKVFVHVRQAAQQHVLIAERAFLQVDVKAGERFMILEDGHRYSGSPGQVNFVITYFERHAVRLDGRDADDTAAKLEAIPTRELWQSPSVGHTAELQWRASLPLSSLLLGILAMPLSRTSPRHGKYARFFTAVVIYFVYNNALGIAQKLVERGELNPWIGVWPVHLAIVLTTALMFMWPRISWRKYYPAKLWASSNSEPQ